MHQGVHPRVGAADVVPVVPLAPGEVCRAVDVARAVGARVGKDLGLPVFLYGEVGGGRRPAFFRRGGAIRAAAAGRRRELDRATGPAASVGGGAVLLGLRQPLVTFSLELRGRLALPATSQQPCASPRAGCPASGARPPPRSGRIRCRRT
jgi:glutamate formiminotransferase